ncbi:hypothetical protein MMC18_009366 [Xylographa bjoerkii]|nr:hypothetical protein [Xylographa bjoerkii]
MALSFAVNLGPLSGVEFGYKDVATAVNLANDLYGWFKARERAVSLEQTLASTGTSLVPSFTFDSNLYMALRRDHSKAWGVARNITNALRRLQLPRASTATEGSRGLLCLRALTTGLLCFVDQEQASYILKDVLPLRLFHYEQADKEITIEGPYLAALIHYVQSIATEEGADDIRAHLLSHTDSQLHRVTSAKLAEMQNIQNTEVGHLTGFLDWLLTSVSKRQTNCYRTRSLKVWCLALVLSELGFEAEAERTAIVRPPDQSRISLGDEYYNGRPMVVLVLASGWSTDCARKLSDTRHDTINRPIRVPPRLIPVRALPSLVFADHAHKFLAVKSVSVATNLEKAFFGTYTFVRYRLSCDQRIRHATRLSGPLQIDGSKYRYLLDSSCDIEDIKDYFDLVDYSDGNPATSNLLASLMVPSVRRYLIPFAEVYSRPDLMLTYLLVAFVLAVMSLFVMGDDVASDDLGFDLQLLYTECLWNRTDTSVLEECFAKSVLFISYLFSDSQSWEKEKLSKPFQNKPSQNKPSQKKPSQNKPFQKKPVSRIAVRPDSWSSLVLKVMLDMDRLPSLPGHVDLLRHYWGAQRQGLVLISDFVLNPSTHAASAYLYHCLRGHLLDIPTKEGRVVEGSSTTPTTPMTNGLLSGRDAVLSVVQNLPPTYLDSLRIDLEPCWESDATTCRFVLRAAGIPRLQLGISSLFTSTKISTYSNTITTVRCADLHICPGPESIIRMILDHNERHAWSSLSLSSMIEEGWLGFDRQPDPVLNDEEKEKQRIQNFLVNAYSSDILVMLALHAPYNASSEGCHRIVSDCLGAALMARLTHSSPATMIILSNERHNRVLEAMLPEYDKREDCLQTAASIIYHERRDRYLGSSLDAHMAFQQLANLIVQEPRAYHYVEKIISCLRHYKDSKAITQAGILQVLRAIDISKVVIPKCAPYTEYKVFEQLAQTLVAQWQKENMSESELAEMVQYMELADEEIDRSDDLALLGHVVSDGQEDPLAIGSEADDPLQA